MPLLNWSRHMVCLTAVGLVTVPTAYAADTLTRDNGAVVGDNQNSQTAGAQGPVLLQDVQLLQKLQRFDRERIPERVVHARGTGVKGEFTASADISDLSKATVFKSGEKTPVFVRFSSVVHGNHSPEALRDPHGFATKFYTADGNWDLVGNNFPTFFIRDAIKFPDMVHAFKPDPRTNLDNDSRRFDFFSHVPEATRTLTLLYSNEGTPAGYRFMDGNGVHAYKLVNAKGEVHYVKFHWKTLQGIKNLDPKEVAQVQSKDYSHLTNDLVGAIKKGDFPKWDLYVQVLKPEELSKFDFDPLDATKIWPDVPGRPRPIKPRSFFTFAIKDFHEHEPSHRRSPYRPAIHRTLVATCIQWRKHRSGNPAELFRSGTLGTLGLQHAALAFSVCTSRHA